MASGVSGLLSVLLDEIFDCVGSHITAESRLNDGRIHWKRKPSTLIQQHAHILIWLSFRTISSACWWSEWNLKKDNWISATNVFVKTWSYMSVIEGHLIDLIDHITLSVDLTLWHIPPALTSSLPSLALLHLAQVRASLSVDFLLSVSVILSLVYFWFKIHSFHKYFPSQTAGLPQDCLHWLSLLPGIHFLLYWFLNNSRCILKSLWSIWVTAVLVSRT